MADAVEEERVDRITGTAVYANITIGMAASGILLFMAIYGFSVFLETPKELRKGRTPYIVLSLIITTLAVLSSSLDCAWLFEGLLGSTSGSGFLANLGKNGRSWKRFLSVGASMVTVSLGDALLVYRCYVIWKRTWWIVVLPALTLLASIVTSFFALIREIDAKRSNTFEAARQLLTVSTNILVTVLISFYLLRARSTLSMVFASKDLKLYTGVVAILIESALPLSVFGIICAAMGLAGVPEKNPEHFLVAWYTFNALFFAFCPLAPVMIIFRITTGNLEATKMNYQPISIPALTPAVTAVTYPNTSAGPYVAEQPDRTLMQDSRPILVLEEQVRGSAQWSSSSSAHSFLSSMASALDPEYISRVAARAMYANIMIALVTVGIQIFMSIYGLSVFLETPQKLRQGRTRYIILSFVLTGLMALPASLDAAWIFNRLFGATSGLGFRHSINENVQVWERYLSLGSATAMILIGDALLIYRCYVVWTHRWWVTILPVLTLLSSSGVSILILSRELEIYPI
ncbi:hypothetical protein H1R20_g455, partial [Candolleomyces eurysporus]